MKLTVVKCGGAILEDEGRKKSLLDAFAAIQGSKILVHGGGRSATALASRLGIKTRMVEGRRITDAPMLEVVAMVYGGLVNKSLVAYLQAKGLEPLGVTGADMGLILSDRRPVRDGVDYGFVGDVRKVDAEAFRTLLEAGITPVVAPLTCDGRGGLLNTNADTVASSVASSLSGYYDVSLVFCFEKEGVLGKDGKPVGKITRETYTEMKADGSVAGGMIPKLDNAFAAIDKGVGSVRITKWDSPEGGTLIC